MPERARVTSLEAIESFRAKLIIYRDKAGRILDEVNEEMVRTRLWLQNDRRIYWQSQIDRRTRELEERRQELFSSQLSGLREASYMQQVAVQKARQALRDAEARLQRVKQWERQFDERVEPLARGVEKLRHNLGHDLVLALAWLAEVSQTLNAYAELSPPGMTAPPQPAESGNASETGSGPESTKGSAQP